MKRTNWFDRKFPKIEDNGLIPTLIERLAGTPARIRAMVGRKPSPLLDNKPDNRWSIKEEIGHLSDLEPLWYGRIEDFKSRKPEMRAADLTNRATHEANHNAIEISKLIGDFQRKREKFVHLLLTLKDDELIIECLHPRLKTPMRAVDLAYFVAEHDDHHLAAIREILLANSTRS